jgi:hypothetical protein
MIEVILNIIDRLLSVRKRRLERYKALFEELVEPTFNDLMRVHAEDMDMLEKTRQELLTGVSTQIGFGDVVREMAKELRERQLKFEPVRSKLRAIAKETHSLGLLPSREYSDFLGYQYALQQYRQTFQGVPEEFTEFAFAVLNYLPDGTIHSRWLRAEEFVNRLSKLADALPNTKILILNAWPNDLSHEWSVIQVESCLDMTINNQRKGWDFVCDTFARAKIGVAKAK